MINGSILILAVIFLSVLSVPVGFALLFVALTFLWVHYGGLDGGITGIVLSGITTWDTVRSWELTAIPLFVFMGELTASSGLGRDAFDCFNMWLARIKGSLAIVTTLASAAFGAVTGSTAATIVTIGSISIKEMKRLGYSAPIRTGAVAVAGILANLIPPSILAIIYSSLTGVSLGKVLIAGLIPGILLTFLFAMTIFVRGIRNPTLFPTEVRTFSLREKLSSLRLPMPIFVIFALMIGGIYWGIFSPTEAAGAGCALVLITTLSLRRMGWKAFTGSVGSGVRTTGFIMLLIIGATLFSSALAITRFPFLLADEVIALDIPPIATMLIFITLMIVLGCVLDALALLILFIPLFLPVVEALGYSPVWFGTLSVLLIEIAAITPPISANIWITKGIDPDATVMDVTRGVFPYYIAALVLLVLLLLFPELATWLPSQMMG
jgi:tripartite ATP-independent transporter DctM subunit